MSPSEVPDHAWAALLTDQTPSSFEFLATKILLASLRQRLRSNSVSVPDAIRELRTFFDKYSKLPSAQRDLAKIFTK